MKPDTSAAEKAKKRFLKKAVLLKNGCWIWVGALSKNGYGSFWFKGKGGSAHNASYRLFVGGVPKDLTIDHLCRMPACVNPNHFELVSIKENIMRGDGVTAVNARKTHCLNGHPFDKENTYIQPSRKYGRRCRKCQRIKDAHRKI